MRATCDADARSLMLCLLPARLIALHCYLGRGLIKNRRTHGSQEPWAHQKLMVGKT